VFEALHADSLCGFDEFIEPDTSVNPEPLRVTDASKYFYHFANQPISLLNLSFFHILKSIQPPPEVWRLLVCQEYREVNSTRLFLLCYPPEKERLGG